MTHTDRGVEVAKAIQAIVELNKSILGLDSVYYGIQRNVPDGLSVAVTPSRKINELVGVQGPGGRVDRSFFTLITLNNSHVGDEATERELVDNLAEELEDILHDDTTLGGIVIHGFITDIENGVSFRDNSMFRTVQLTHRARTRTLI